MENFWQGVGATVALLTLVFTIYKYYISKVNVKAKVNDNDFFLPNELMKSLKDINKVSWKIKSGIESAQEAIFDENVDESIISFLNALERSGFMEMFGPKRCIQIEIGNYGSKTVKKLEVDVNTNFPFEIKKNDNWQNRTEDIKEVELRPDEKVEYRFWSDSFLSEEIKILNETGRVKQIKYEKISTTQYWIWNSIKGIVIFSSFWLVFFLLQIF